MPVEPRDGNAAGPTNKRREQLLEVLVFLFLIVPSMGLSFFAIRQGTLSFVLKANATILRDLALVCLIAFFLWRNSETLSQIGLNFRNRWQDVLLGVFLFFPLFFLMGVLEQLLRAAGFTAPSTPMPRFLKATGSMEMVLAFVLVVVVAFAEETIFRGYLISRFATITRSTTVAVILSSAIFALGHGYEGTAGVVTIGVMGLAFALVYVWRQSLVAPMVMHFLQDFVGIVLFPLLKSS